MYVGAFETSRFYNMLYLVMFITAVCLLFLLKLKHDRYTTLTDVVTGTGNASNLIDGRIL